MKKIVYLVLTLLLSLFIIFYPRLSIASGPVVISVVPVSQNINVGEVGTIDLSLDPNGANVAGAQLVITYDSSLIQVTDITPGIFFNSNYGAPMVFVKDLSIPGKIVYLLGFPLGSHYYSTTPGVLATISFTAMVAGISPIAFVTDSAQQPHTIISNNLADDVTDKGVDGIVIVNSDVSTPEPTMVPSPTPEITPTPSPTSTPTPEPTPEPTLEPTPTPEITPTPTNEPSVTPTIESTPTPVPTLSPTDEPSATPTPTVSPTPVPTTEPTTTPTNTPTPTSTVTPTATPTPQSTSSSRIIIYSTTLPDSEASSSPDTSSSPQILGASAPTFSPTVVEKNQKQEFPPMAVILFVSGTGLFTLAKILFKIL